MESLLRQPAACTNDALAVKFDALQETLALGTGMDDDKKLAVSTMSACLYLGISDLVELVCLLSNAALALGKGLPDLAGTLCAGKPSSAPIQNLMQASPALKRVQ